MVAVFFLKETRGISLHDVDAADAQGTADLLAACQEVAKKYATNDINGNSPGPALRDPGCCRCAVRLSLPGRLSAARTTQPARTSWRAEISVRIASSTACTGAERSDSARATAQMGSCRWKSSGSTGRNVGVADHQEVGQQADPGAPPDGLQLGKDAGGLEAGPRDGKLGGPVAQFGDLQRRLHVGDKAVLPDVVERLRQPVFPGVLRAGVEPEEIVGQEDRSAHC